jgi:hypothetical protein
MPDRKVPASSSGKLCAWIAKAPTAPPPTPRLEPSRKPARRPWRFMKKDAGRVDIAAPST